ncbi:hypothetical protein DL769_005261 [Monosporascus sp. CRB-8-3]|nr:hypothetical protein DL769_005261 [Monosporascus sp. CRB-8-3]
MDQLGSRKRPILVVDEEYETHKKARNVAESGANSGNAERPAKNFPVQLIFSGSVVKVNDESTNKSIGFLASTTLCHLADKFSVTLAATLSVGKPYGAKTFRQWSNIRLGTLRVIVYGYNRERESLANFLSQHGVFLQHPQASEYDRRVPYMNPQYLLRPGTEVPSLDHLTIDASPPAEEPLSELQKSRVLQIFECANGAGAKTTSRVEPSTRLITALKR